MNTTVLRNVWSAFNEDKVMRLASSIAFTTIFSIAPLLIILIAVAGWVLGLQNGGHGHHLAENALLDRVRAGAGQGTADAIRGLVSASFNKPRQGLVAQIVGWIAFAAGATALFSALQDALNAIWHVESTKGGWRQILRDRSASFAMILIIGFLLLVSFAASAGIAFVGAHFLNNVAFLGNPAVLAALEQVVMLGIVTVVFALIYKVLPDVKLRWHDVWLGAVVTAVLFVIGEALIAWYLAFAGVASAYGAAGTLLAALLWIYYSVVVLLLGAEFTKVSAGHATTTVAGGIRTIKDQPAGVDPRSVETRT